MSQEPLLDELLSKFRSGTASDQERTQLAILAGKSEGPTGRDILWELLSDSDEEVRRYAVHGLALGRGERSPALLRKLWEIFAYDPDEDVRSMAVASLGSALAASRDRDAFSRLKLALVNEKSPYLLRSIFDAILSLMGVPKGEWAAVKLSWRELPHFKVDWKRVDELEASFD
jgi:HEAT repeat protein